MTEVKNDEIRSEAIAFTKLEGPNKGITPDSGRRRVLKEKKQHTEVKKTVIKGTQGYEQDITRTSSSSNWKEYLFDGKHIKGVFLDNNMLLWFESSEEVDEHGVGNIVKDKYPDQKPVATFDLARKNDSDAEADLAVFSASDREDLSIGPLIDYFGRSFDWRGDVKLEVRFADPLKPHFKGDFQSYLFQH